MKRTIIWIDSTDKDTHQICTTLKELLHKTGVRYTLFEACEIIEAENE